MYSVINSLSLLLPLKNPNTKTVTGLSIRSPDSFFLPLRFNGLQYRASASALYNPKTTPINLPHSKALFDRDWSFLEQNPNSSKAVVEQVVSAGEVEQASKVLVCMGTEAFVDYLCSSFSCKVFVLHYSLFILASIKEKHDRVRCRQGGIVPLASSWAPLDVVFINYLPALSCSLDQMFQTLVQNCAPGARVIISHTQGRDQINVHKKSNPDVITGDLPDRIKLEKVLESYPLQLINFSDESGFYLATLKVCKGENSKT
eukprot:Gb_39344 [translate_table: standard]